MDLDLSADDLAFREAARAWLREHVPSDPRPHDPVEARAFDLAWQREQYDGGWAGITWPAEHGGLGTTLVRQMLWYEEYALAGAPWIGSCFVGINHAGPTLIVGGSEAQRVRHLPRILRGEEVWCQGFSEPDAGSDLASLSTHAELDGDELVVSGQKVWTSFADVADHQELLVRTDPDAPKHKGITWVICDMHAPGIEIRPIRTMARNAEFAEVFYDEVRIPVSNVVGEVNDGWSVAMSTLSFERGSGFMAEQVELARTVEDLIAEANERTDHRGRPLLGDDATARDLAALRAEVTALRSMTLAGISRNLDGGPPGAEGSIVRLYHAELVQRVHETAMQVLGTDSLAFVRWGVPGGWTGGWLWHHAATIGGGTSDIQRTIIGERVLGLPR